MGVEDELLALCPNPSGWVGHLLVLLQDQVSCAPSDGLPVLVIEHQVHPLDFGALPLDVEVLHLPADLRKFGFGDKFLDHVDALLYLLLAFRFC